MCAVADLNFVELRGEHHQGILDGSQRWANVGGGGDATQELFWTSKRSFWAPAPPASLGRVRALVRLLLAERVARAAPLRRILRPLRGETLHVHRVSGTAGPHPGVSLLPEQRTGLHRSGQATTAIASATPVRARPGRRATQAGSASADPARVAGPE